MFAVAKPLLSHSTLISTISLLPRLYFGLLIYINDKALYTISLGIANMRASYGFSNFAWIMAATCMSVLPIIVLFFFAQRTFIEGIALSGLKG